MNKRKIITLILLVVICTGSGIFFLIMMPNPLKKGISGAIFTDTTWGPGEVIVSGDVIVMPTATLTILPGTTIKVLADESDLNVVRMADEDVDLFTKGDPTADPKSGGNDFQKNHNTIIVMGKIICIGTPELPIIITSSRALNPSETPYYTDWVGLNVNYGEFAYTAITWCIDPVYARNGYEKLTFDHCYIAHSWAAAVGWMEPKDGAIKENAFIKYSTIRDYGHEAIDTHSTGHLEIAYCDIADGQVGLNFHDDIVAEGNHLTVDAHHNIIRNTSFPVLATDGAVVNLTQNLLSSETITTERWNYLGYTMKSVIQEGIDAAVFCPPGDYDAANTMVNLKHNILYQSSYGIRKDSSEINLSESYNNYDQCTIQFQGENLIQGPGTLSINSEFVNANTGNFMLTSTSSLKNAGDPSLGSPDIGPYGGMDASDEIGWIPVGYDTVL